MYLYVTNKELDNQLPISSHEIAGYLGAILTDDTSIFYTQANSPLNATVFTVYYDPDDKTLRHIAINSNQHDKTYPVIGENSSHLGQNWFSVKCNSVSDMMNLQKLIGRVNRNQVLDPTHKLQQLTRVYLADALYDAMLKINNNRCFSTDAEIRMTCEKVAYGNDLYNALSRLFIDAKEHNRDTWTELYSICWYICLTDMHWKDWVLKLFQKAKQNVLEQEDIEYWSHNKTQFDTLPLQVCDDLYKISQHLLPNLTLENYPTLSVFYDELINQTFSTSTFVLDNTKHVVLLPKPYKDLTQQERQQKKQLDSIIQNNFNFDLSQFYNALELPDRKETAEAAKVKSLNLQA